MDLKAKLATAALKGRYQKAGLIGDDGNEPSLDDFHAVTGVIKSVASSEGFDPFAFMLALRFTNPNPQREVTDCEFDDLCEAVAYCERMNNTHNVLCWPNVIEVRRIKIERKP